MPDDSLVYLYGVVPGSAPEPPESLRGIDETSVRLVAAGKLAGVVSTVAAGAYRAEALDARLSDVGWVGQRGMEHERVLTWFVDRTTVIPSAPFSLHATDERVRERLAGHAVQLERTLERVAGHREMGIRIWRDEARFAEHLGRRSAALMEMEQAITAATPGRRYLLQKKLDALRAEERARVSGELVRRAERELRAAAADACLLSIPPIEGQPRDRTLVLYAAYLVPSTGGAAFDEAVQRVAAEHLETGLEWEYTGPWPPYHFVSE